MNGGFSQEMARGSRILEVELSATSSIPHIFSSAVAMIDSFVAAAALILRALSQVEEVPMSKLPPCCVAHWRAASLTPQAVDASHRYVLLKSLSIRKSLGRAGKGGLGDLRLD